MKKIFIILISSLTFLFAVKADAQEKNVTENIKDIIAKKQFTFLAETAVPSNFRSRPLSFGYDLQVAPDSIISHLPYFGRAYSAPLDPSKGGIQFISTDFKYQVEEKDKGGWVVTILPKDFNDVQQMYLHVTENGYATLQVVSTFRQPISFHGRIKERKYLRAF